MMRRHLLCLAACCLAACNAEDQPYPEHATYKAKALDPLPCVPNLDGHIDANELKAALGVPAKYVVSTAPRQVSVAGTTTTAGLHWAFTGDYADDRSITIQAVPPDGLWFASSFPGASFVAPFDAGGTLQAIYTETDQSITLLGLASTTEMPADGKTLIVYDPPIDAYRFPLAPGLTWVSTGTVKNGMIRGLPYAGKDTYEITVDAAGSLDLPDITFSQALRVRTKVTVEPAAGMAVVTRQASYVFECFGEVARVTSNNGEMNADFTTAAEVRRFGF
jgi:hypothetical protein